MVYLKVKVISEYHPEWDNEKVNMPIYDENTIHEFKKCD
ncbi:hypothetical protein TrispH2_001301 [Trichoplax sp. H2]|nr:hypothetical protein TrispH2_001301 [Trichoplax sp. H2]|eukprot:RDD46353.1 hypothetical protein TrispH2_001301 [Trichoplax sp. H2]